MQGDGRDEVVRSRVWLRCDDESRVRLTVRQYRVDPAGIKQLLPCAHCENRLAVAVLVFDSVTLPWRSPGGRYAHRSPASCDSCVGWRDRTSPTSACG